MEVWKKSRGTRGTTLDGEDWCEVRHGRLIIALEGTTEEEDIVAKPTCSVRGDRSAYLLSARGSLSLPAQCEGIVQPTCSGIAQPTCSVRGDHSAYLLRDRSAYLLSARGSFSLPAQGSLSLPAQCDWVAKVHCLPFNQLSQQLMVEVVVIKDLFVVVFRVVSSTNRLLRHKYPPIVSYDTYLTQKTRICLNEITEQKLH